MYKELGISDNVVELSKKVEKDIEGVFKEINLKHTVILIMMLQIQKNPRFKTVIFCVITPGMRLYDARRGYSAWD